MTTVAPASNVSTPSSPSSGTATTFKATRVVRPSLPVSEADKRGVAASVAVADGELADPTAHFAKCARSATTNVELLQQLPPMFSWFVLECTLPTAPDPTPRSPGFAHEAQGWVLRSPPYDRQKSMPKYMPVI